MQQWTSPPGETLLEKAARLLREFRKTMAQIQELLEENTVLREELQETHAEIAEMIARVRSKILSGPPRAGLTPRAVPLSPPRRPA
jgi:multidrug resistance efflux pump